MLSIESERRVQRGATLLLLLAMLNAWLSGDTRAIEQPEPSQNWEVSGIIFEGLLDEEQHLVVNQPGGEREWVDKRQGVFTHYDAAFVNGEIDGWGNPLHEGAGLLADSLHPTPELSLLKPGMHVRLIMEDGSEVEQEITQVDYFRALAPSDPHTYLQIIESGMGEPGEIVSATQAFQEFYTEPGTITIQTCISAQGQFNAGRVFFRTEAIEASDN